MSFLQETIDKLTTGNKMQYILVGTLVLVIVFALVSVFMPGGGKNQQFGSGERRYKCEECGEEFTVKPKKTKGRPRPDDMMRKAECPKCGERAGAAMQKCPKCEKWFVQEYTPEGVFCTFCDTNIHEWYRENREAKK